MTQCRKILRYMQTNGAITPLVALTEFNCFRLAARIKELRVKHDIVKKMIKMPVTGKTVASYSLKEKQDAV